MAARLLRGCTGGGRYSRVWIGRDVGYSFKMNGLGWRKAMSAKSSMMLFAGVAAFAAAPLGAQVRTGLATPVRPAAPPVKSPPKATQPPVTPEAPVPGNPDYAPQPAT